MMKKMRKVALLAAALAFTAGLAGCFVSAVEDDGSGSGSTAQGSGSTAQDGGSGSGGTTYTLDISTVNFTKGSSDGEGSAEINGMKFEVKANTSKTLPDTQGGVSVVNMGGAVSTSANYIKFTTTKTSSVTVSFHSGGNSGRTAKIINDSSFSKDGDKETDGNNKNIITVSFSNLPTDTYYLGSKTSGLYITKVVVTEME